MSKQSFNIDKSIRLNPIDPSTITSPKNGEIACDSTDSNRLKKYNETKSIWEAVSGSVAQAYICEAQNSGTAGGASVAATQNVRTLNTLVDSYSIVTSLSSNTFTLPAGTYSIMAIAPAHGVGLHKIRLRNTTDSTTVMYGSSEKAPSISSGTVLFQSASMLFGEVTISAAKDFQLQHYTQNGVSNNGLGIAVSSGEPEIFAQVFITKIK